MPADGDEGPCRRGRRRPCRPCCSTPRERPTTKAATVAAGAGPAVLSKRKSARAGRGSAAAARSAAARMRIIRNSLPQGSAAARRAPTRAETPAGPPPPAATTIAQVAPQGSVQLRVSGKERRAGRPACPDRLRLRRSVREPAERCPHWGRRHWRHGNLRLHADRESSDRSSLGVPCSQTSKPTSALSQRPRLTKTEYLRIEPRSNACCNGLPTMPSRGRGSATSRVATRTAQGHPDFKIARMGQIAGYVEVKTIGREPVESPEIRPDQAETVRQYRPDRLSGILLDQVGWHRDPAASRLFRRPLFADPSLEAGIRGCRSRAVERMLLGHTAEDRKGAISLWRWPAGRRCFVIS